MYPYQLIYKRQALITMHPSYDEWFLYIWHHVLIHFPSPSWQKRKERGSLVKFLQEEGNWSHDFLKVGPLTQETVYPPWNMYITLIILYIFTSKQFAWNVFHIFQDYWCVCLSHLILSLIISYPINNWYCMINWW